MYCPSCGVESKNKDQDFCEGCSTNLVLIQQFLERPDAKFRRSRLASRSGLVSLTISEGFAWTLLALVIFVLIIFLATIFFSKETDPNAKTYLAFAILLALIAFCGIPFLLGLVLLLKDLTEVRTKKGKSEKFEENN
jgi:uncharacterized membrane protein YbhN (UPF0104 family)